MEEVMNKIEGIIVDIGLSELQVQDCMEFLTNQTESTNFLNTLPYVDLYMLPEEVQQRIVAVYREAKQRQKDLAGNLFKLLFGVGKQSLFALIKPYEI